MVPSPSPSPRNEYRAAAPLDTAFVAKKPICFLGQPWMALGNTGTGTGMGTGFLLSYFLRARSPIGTRSTLHAFRVGRRRLQWSA